MGLAGLAVLRCGEDPRSVLSTPRAKLFAVQGPEYDFGGRFVGSETDQTFVYENVGELAASGFSGALYSSGFAFVGGAFPGEGGTCGPRLEVGERCRVVVRFKPVSLSGYSDTLRVYYHDGAGTRQVTLFPLLSGHAN